MIDFRTVSIFADVALCAKSPMDGGGSTYALHLPRNTLIQQITVTCYRVLLCNINHFMYNTIFILKGLIAVKANPFFFYYQGVSAAAGSSVGAINTQ